MTEKMAGVDYNKVDALTLAHQLVHAAQSLADAIERRDEHSPRAYWKEICLRLGGALNEIHSTYQLR